MLTCVSCLLATLLSFGQTVRIVCALGLGASSYKSSADQRPTGDAMLLASRMNAATKSLCGANCPEVVVFRNSTASNAMFVAEGAQAKLVYSPQFFASVYDSFGDPGILAIIAHELGHGLDDALGAAWIKNDWAPEMRADAWAGCALAKAALTARNVQPALEALARSPSPSHPAWTLRLPAIRIGYTSCGGDGSAFTTSRSASALSPAKPGR